MNKEELNTRVGTLEAQLDSARARDKEMRMQFSSTFNWKKQKGQYDYSEETYDPSWNDIFVKIGRLLQDRECHDMEKEVRYMRDELNALRGQYETLNTTEPFTP